LTGLNGKNIYEKNKFFAGKKFFADRRNISMPSTISMAVL
jgi:hypothetical protein